MKTIAYISCLGVIAALTVEFGVIGILPQLADYYRISIDKAGQLLGVYEVVAAVSGPFVALLVSNIDRKKVIVACLLVSLLASLLSATAPPFGLLLVARVGVALTDSVFHAVTLASVIRNIDEQQDAKMTAIVLSGFSIASVTLIPFTAFLGSAMAWQAAFMVEAVVSGSVMLLVVFVFPPLPVLIRKTHREQLHLLTRPLFWGTAALCFFMVASAFCLYSYFADYFRDAKQLSGQQVSSLLLLFGAMGILGNWLAGVVAGRHLLGAALATLLSVVLVALGLAYSGSGLVLNGLVVAGWGVLFAFGPLIITTYISRASPEEMEFGFALTASCIGLGIAAGTAFGGWVLVTYGTAWAPWSGTGFCLAAILTLGVIRLLENSRAPQSVAA